MARRFPRSPLFELDGLLRRRPGRSRPSGPAKPPRAATRPGPPPSRLARGGRGSRHLHLVDTGAWYALADRSDRHHAAARRFFSTIAGNEDLVTTDAILVESWSLIRAHLGRPPALAFWAGLRDAGVSLQCLQAVDLEAAWRIVEAWSDQDFNFTDGSSFAVMERLGLERCFAFDDHFLVYRYGPRRTRAFVRLPA